MSETNGLKGKFKSRGTSILKSAPSSMKEFLNDGYKEDSLKSEASEKYAQINKDTITQTHNNTNHQNQDGHYEESCKNSNEITRIHVHIRKELTDKMFNLMFRRKKNRKGIATQRAIIEEALEGYFRNHGK